MAYRNIDWWRFFNRPDAMPEVPDLPQQITAPVQRATIDAGFMDGATEFDGHDITGIWQDEVTDTDVADTHITPQMLRQARSGVAIRALERQTMRDVLKAADRAELLLKQVLPHALWEAYEKSGTFKVGPPKTKQAYTLSKHAKTNVEGRWQYCIAPESDSGFDLPVADRLVAEYLLLVNDEDGYLKVANLSPIGTYPPEIRQHQQVRQANYTTHDIARACLRLYCQMPGVRPDRRFDLVRYVDAIDPIPPMHICHQQTFTIDFHLETGPFEYIERTLVTIVRELANLVTTYLTDHQYRIERYVPLPLDRPRHAGVLVESEDRPQGRVSLRLSQDYDIQTGRYLFQLATQVIMTDLRPPIR